MIGKLIGTAVALAALIGLPVGLEAYAGAQLGRTVRTAVEAVAPGATVTRVEPHGRPFVAALLDGEISSAYADVTTPTGTTTLILQRLHRDTGRIDTVLWFPVLADPTDLTPVRNAAGAYSPRGTTRLDGHLVEVTYTATAKVGTLTVRPATVSSDGRIRRGTDLPAAWKRALTPPPVRLATARPATVRAVSVGENGITVELRQRDVDTRVAPAADSAH